MSADFLSRVLGMLFLAVAVGWAGSALARALQASELVYTVILGLVGALAGLVLTPYVTVVPLRRLRRSLYQMPAQRLLAMIVGLVIGLMVAAMAAFPLSLLPDPFGQILPVVGAVFFSYLGIAIVSIRQADVLGFLRLRGDSFHLSGRTGELSRGTGVLLDTSVIIDGRIADISRTGFVAGPLIVPNFVLNELQHVADSAETLRRNRGRRGLDMLNRLQKEPFVPVQITDIDVEDMSSVDDKLVILAKELRCPILTNDYNLNKVAELQGVTVLNINELANAVRVVLLPGEDLEIRVIQEGKERDQGVGYLDDGTMVVVEDGEQYIDETVDTVVTKVLQTAAGRMIFARLQEAKS